MKNKKRESYEIASSPDSLSIQRPNAIQNDCRNLPCAMSNRKSSCLLIALCCNVKSEFPRMKSPTVELHSRVSCPGRSGHCKQPHPSSQIYRNILFLTPLFIAVGWPSSSSTPAIPPSPASSAIFSASSASISASVFFFCGGSAASARAAEEAFTVLCPGEPGERGGDAVCAAGVAAAVATVDVLATSCAAWSFWKDMPIVSGRIGAVVVVRSRLSPRRRCRGWWIGAAAARAIFCMARV